MEMSDSSNKAAPPVQPGAIFQFLRENFAVISGLAVVGGIGLSTIFLSAYLSFFDWHLLWFVQYTDILTFGLIAVGIIGGSLIFLQNSAQTIITALRIDGEKKRWYLIGFGLLLLAILGLNVWSSIHRRDIITSYLVQSPLHLGFSLCSQWSLSPKQASGQTLLK